MARRYDSRQQTTSSFPERISVSLGSETSREHRERPMADLNFSQVEAALIEANVTVMRGMRDSLLQLGLQKVHPCPTVDAFAELLGDQTPDLVVVDIDHPDIDSFKLIRWLRNDPDFPNPFICIIATTWQPTEALLQRVNNSGADALLVKPASARQLMDRVLALVDGRKKFIVTADYTGPDRRRQLRDSVHMPSLEPPTSLRLKATGSWDRGGASLVAKGVAWIDEQKAIRDAFHISFLVAYAEPGLATEPPDRLALDHVARIPPVVDDLLRRVAKRGLDSRFESACKAILETVERIGSNTEFPSAINDLVQLRTLGLGLIRALQPSRSADVVMKEVSGAAAAYRKRLEQLWAAKAAQGPGAGAAGAESSTS
jgi:CheY-like chemotaxis protein